MKLGLIHLGMVLGAGLGACRADAGIDDLVRGLPSSSTGNLGALVKSTDVRCATTSAAVTTDATQIEPGHVVFRLPDGHDYRVEAREGASLEDLTHELDAIGPGADGFVNASADGQWLLVQTSRFGCGQDMCLAVVDRSACSAQIIVSSRDAVHPGATSAIAPKGNVVVFPDAGAHPADLFAVTRRPEGGWTAPVNITASSPSPYNKQPAISPDGTKLLFDCGPDSGAGEGTAICEVGVDGSGFRVAVAPDARPERISANHHAGYAPDGSIVFEGTWNGGAEQVWRAAGGAPELVNRDVTEDGKSRFTDDNSPCVLPDGRIVSLWLGREGTGADHKASGHELKMMNADGGGFTMLVTGIDVVDVGIGCAR